MPDDFTTPPAYVLSHLFLGAAAVAYPVVVPCFLMYQMAQYALNIRIFMFEACVVEGNSLWHTFCKVGHFTLGCMLGQTSLILNSWRMS